MFWPAETQSATYDDPLFIEGERWSHFLSNIVLWAPGDPPQLEQKVRKAIASIDPSLVLYGVTPYSEVVDGDFRQQNMIATLTTLFGAVGLYGVMTYTVEQRTSEIGLRMALGANRSNVVTMVLRGAAWQIGIGLG